MEQRTDLGERYEGSIGGSAFNGHGRPSRTFSRGRVCNEGSCETRLSIYNEGHFCYQHEPRATPRMRGKKVA